MTIYSLALLAALSSTIANATLITFDDLTPRSSDQIPRPYHGLVFSGSPYDGIRESVSSDIPGVHNGVVSGANVLLGAIQANSIQPSDVEHGALFTFNSGYFTAAFDDSLMVEATGFRPGDILGTSFEKTFAISSSGPTFVSFDWTGLNEIELAGRWGATYSNPQFVMDDLTVNVNTPNVSTPEPATNALFVLALLVLLPGLGKGRLRQGFRNCGKLLRIIPALAIYASAAFGGTAVVTDGKFTNIYVFPGSNANETWEQHIAAFRPGDAAKFSRASIDRFTDQLMRPGWPSYFDSLFQYSGIRPPQFFGSAIATKKCVDAALKDAYQGVVQWDTIRTLSNCHENGKDPSPQVNLIFSPDIHVAAISFPTSHAPDMCTQGVRGWHGWGISTPNYTVLPTSSLCMPSFEDFTSTMTHEIVETISDPAGFGVGTLGQNELGDKCENRADGYTAFNGYAVSRYWSDFDGNCQPQFDPPRGSVAQTWVLGAGSPLGTLGGNVHQFSVDVPASRVVTDSAATNVLLLLQTTALRGGTDNVDVTLNFNGGNGSQVTRNVNQGRAWQNGETHGVILSLPAVRVRDITAVTVTSDFRSVYFGTSLSVLKAALIVSFPAESLTVSPKLAVQHDWIDVSGAPLWRFTSDKNDGTVLSLPFWPQPDPGMRARALDLVVYTGNDDVRSDSTPDVYLRLLKPGPSGGFSIFLCDINGGYDWNNWSIHSIPIPLPAVGITSAEIGSLDLVGNMGGYWFPFTSPDNWNVNRLRLVATLADNSSAAFISQSVPANMVPGQRYLVSVTMTNTGNATWTAAGQYRLGSQNPQDNNVWQSSGRIPLPGGIIPGSAVTFSFPVTAPSTPGTYNFQWRMVQDGVEWFGEYTPNVAVVVEPAECQSIRAAIQSDNDEIKQLLAEWKTLDIKFPGDKIRIEEIKVQIAELKADIQRQENREGAIGCQK